MFGHTQLKRSRYRILFSTWTGLAVLSFLVCSAGAKVVSSTEFSSAQTNSLEQKPSGEKIEIKSEGQIWTILYSSPSQIIFGAEGCIPRSKLKWADAQIRQWQSKLPTLQNCTLEKSRVEESESLKEGCQQYKDEIFFVKQESVYRCSDMYVALMRKKISAIQVDYSSDGLKIHSEEWLTHHFPLY